MQQNNWRVGNLFGIPLFLDPSWFLIVIFVTFVNAQDFLPRFGAVSWFAGFVMALLLFGSVLLHELGHSLVALRQGIKVKSITLFLFGGVAAIERESKTPLGAFGVAIAGPMVSLALFAVFALVAQLFPVSSLVRILTLDLSRINLVLAIFNMIPGLPLDGGQVLKALVWQITGDKFQGVRWAATSGKFFGGLGIAFGLSLLVITRQFGSLWIALIGLFIYRNAESYDQRTTLEQALQKITAADAMTRDFRVVDANLTLRQFTEDYILNDLQKSFPYYASADGRYRGLVAMEDLHKVERSQWDIRNLTSITRPLGEISVLPEKASLVEVINCLETAGLNFVTILSPAETVAGVVDRGDVVRSIAAKLGLPVSETEIKRIKTEGVYPPGLQLAVLAKSIL
jgi:Zn-dependent protease